MGKYLTRIESADEEEENAGWSSNTWNQEGGWPGSQSGNDQQNTWEATAAATEPLEHNKYDNLVAPADSASNVESNTGWESSAPTPPAKNATMLYAAPNMARGRNHSLYGDATAHGFQNMLGVMAEQRQAQHKELSEELQKTHLRAQDIAYAHQYPGQGQRTNSERGRQGKHRREENASSAGGWNQAPRNSHASNAVAQTEWGGGWGTVESTAPPAANANSWSQAETTTITKSKKKRKNKGNNEWDTAGQSTSVTPGGFGSTASAGGWGTADANAGGWPDAGVQAPGLEQSQSWGDWPQEDANQTEQKRPGFFARLFKRGSKKGKGKQKELEAEKDPWNLAANTEKKGKAGKEKNVQINEGTNLKRSKKTLKKQKFAEPEATAYPAYEGEDYDEIGENGGWNAADNGGEWNAAEGGNGWNNPAPGVPEKAGGGWNNPAGAGGWPDPAPATTGNGWGNPSPAPAANGWGHPDPAPNPATMADGWANPAPASANIGWGSPGAAATGTPSRTFALASGTPQRSRNEINAAEQKFYDSRGDALKPARRAFFSSERLASERIFWYFDPDRDPRVGSYLQWIKHMESQLAVYGFNKFMESGQRGALFTNVEYRVASKPSEPAFDWMTFDDIQKSMDRTLQESLAYYDPTSQILIFVFLLSPSKKSMGIWRRKLPLPENIRTAYGAQVAQALNNQKRQYPIQVDEETRATPATLNRTTSAGRWMNWGR